MQKGILLKYLICLIVVFQFSLFSCKAKELDMSIEGIAIVEQRYAYPYVAPELRRSVILDNMNGIKEGMTIDETGPRH